MASPEGTRDFTRLVVSYFVPPVGVFMQKGIGTDFFINLVLSCFFLVPGIVHAVWVIAKYGPDGQEVPDHQKEFMRLIVAALLPPAGVFMQCGMGTPFLINCVATVFFWWPGMLHAAWVITHRD